MTVLAFDPAAYTVTIWNPWGKSYKPRSPPPLGGYPTRNGVFNMPGSDAAKYCHAVTVEVRIRDRRSHEARYAVRLGTSVGGKCPI